MQDVALLDYSTITYNIEGIPLDKNVIEDKRFSDLQSLAHIFATEDDLPEGVSHDKVLRYLIYMFAPNTPTRTYFPDITKRKQYVLQKIGIVSDTKGEIPEGYSEMCLMNKDWILSRFIAFTRLQCSEDYSIMATAELRLAEMQKYILTMEISKAGDDLQLQKGMDSWRQLIVDSRNRILYDEKSITLQKAVTFSVRADTLGLSPEEYTRLWRDKKEMFPEIIP